MDSKGTIQFINKLNSTIESIQTVQDNGLKYSTNNILVHNELENEHIARELQRYCSNVHQVSQSSTERTKATPQTKTLSSGLSKALKNLELWHQRYSHVSPTTLAKTQRVVEGMPPMPSNTPFFKCPFCEKSKMTKYHVKRSMTPKECFIPMQSLHMDLSFVSGPPNLQGMLRKQEKAHPTLKKSRQGHIGFLTIINAAT